MASWGTPAATSGVKVKKVRRRTAARERGPRRSVWGTIPAAQPPAAGTRVRPPVFAAPLAAAHEGIGLPYPTSALLPARTAVGIQDQDLPHDPLAGTWTPEISRGPVICPRARRRSPRLEKRSAAHRSLGEAGSRCCSTTSQAADVRRRAAAFLPAVRAPRGQTEPSSEQHINQARSTPTPSARDESDHPPLLRLGTKLAYGRRASHEMVDLVAVWVRYFRPLGP